jgi:hypothetical protein
MGEHTASEREESECCVSMRTYIGVCMVNRYILYNNMQIEKRRQTPARASRMVKI